MIDPRGLTAVQWVNYLGDALSPLGVITQKIEVEGDWKEWAQQLMLNAVINRFNPPLPEFFEDWKEWAMRFNQTVVYE